MSCYDDIYNDFPLRCAKLWSEFNDAAEAENLDVTFMLMCAAGGFATPWEHLKIQPGQSKENRKHPAFFNYDDRKYERSLKVIEKALKGPVDNSPLFRELNLEYCYYTVAKEIELIRDLVECRPPSNLDFASQDSKIIVGALRNAISHNNIFAFANNGGNAITDLVFFSEKTFRQKKLKIVDGYHVIGITINDFRAFLTSWFALLDITDRSGKQLKLVVSRALETDDQPVAAYG